MHVEAASTSYAGLVDLYATLAAHNDKKLLRGSWCCINGWRCYSVLHLPTTDTDVDNRRVWFVRSFPHLALPVHTQDVDERISQLVAGSSAAVSSFLRFLKTSHQAMFNVGDLL